MSDNFRIKRAVLGLWLALSIVAFLALTVLARSEVYVWPGKVVGIKDGDTIEVLHAGRSQTIRLYGIDAPERRQDFAAEAKEKLSDLVFGKIVEVDKMDMAFSTSDTDTAYALGLLICILKSVKILSGVSAQA